MLLIFGLKSTPSLYAKIIIQGDKMNYNSLFAFQDILVGKDTSCLFPISHVSQTLLGIFTIGQSETKSFILLTNSSTQKISDQLENQKQTPSYY